MHIIRVKGNLKNTKGLYYAAAVLPYHETVFLKSQEILYEHSLVTNNQVSKQFAGKVLAQLRTDKIGKLVRNDKFILFLGEKYYNKNKHNKSKIDTVRKTTRGEMRLLAKLHQLITTYSLAYIKIFSTCFAEITFTICVMMWKKLPALTMV